MKIKIPEPLSALWNRKKFSLAVGWTVYMGYLAHNAPKELAVDLLRTAAIVLAAYMIGQGLDDMKKGGE